MAPAKFFIFVFLLLLVSCKLTTSQWSEKVGVNTYRELEKKIPKYSEALTLPNGDFIRTWITSSSNTEKRVVEGGSLGPRTYYNNYNWMILTFNSDSLLIDVEKKQTTVKVE